MTVSPTDTGWIDRVIEYLRLGSRGVMVLVDKAHDSHAGYLARAMLKELGQFHEARTAAELRDCPKNAAVLLRLRDPDEVVALNIGRQVVRDNELRVVVWGTHEVMEVLPANAFDFFDWISHRVECAPRRAYWWQVRTLLAAEHAGRPVHWKSNDISVASLAVREAWPGRDIVVYDPYSEHDEDESIMEVLKRAEAVVVLRDGGRFARSAMAECGRRTRVIHLQDSNGLEGFWVLYDDPVSFVWPGAAMTHCEVEVGGELGVKVDDALFTATHDPVASALRATETPTQWQWTYYACGEGGSANLRAFGDNPNALAALEAAVRLRRGETTHLQRALALVCPSSRALELAADPVARLEAALWNGLHRKLESVGRVMALATEAGDYRLVRSLAAHYPEHPPSRAAMNVAEVVTAYEQHGPSAALQSLGRMERDEVSQELAWALMVMDSVSAMDSFNSVDVFMEMEPFLVASSPMDGLGVLGAALVLGRWRRLRECSLEHPRAFMTPIRDLLALAAWAIDHTATTAGLPRTTGAGFSAVIQALVSPAERISVQDLEMARVLLWRSSPDGAGREHWIEGGLKHRVGQQLARLGRRESARLTLLDAEGILERTTRNPKHPLILVARFERIWLDVVEKKAPVEGLDAVLAELEGVLWPEHREVVAARALRRRV